ncbi:hypothetical protein [Paraburkholderia youngii]|uniref:hypothetical protein n=1 Tax=Paraburkholderia youngii TaxID=2782701 RepID=UPI00159256CF|nr:hypothetical protein [Paraburkholderia youngii]NUX57945.1 hypothetical protein [Paraburkholderia youngii]
MNEKFRMKLVIDEVTTPALHARLSAAGSARQRATILRLLAESALQGAGTPDSRPVAMSEASDTLASRLHSASSLAAIESSSEDRQSVGRTEQPVNEAAAKEAHNVEDIADQFAAFL